MFDFEKFPVYIQAESFYSTVSHIIKHTEVASPIKDQLKRASLSIVLNIAEGAGKYSKKDKRNFYVIAKGSVNECVALLRILILENSISEHQFKEGYTKLLEIAKMLSALIRTMNNR